MSSFSERYLAETAAVLAAVDPADLERCAEGLAAVRQRQGRLFVLGVGGSAGHASHAVNDFRKIDRKSVV
jgi:D-sedoheptulose 7-phosphate isomerase